MLREKPKWRTHKGESTEAGHSGGTTRSSEEVPYWGWSEGVVSISLTWWSTSDGRSHWVRQGRVIAADRWEPDESRDSRPVLGGGGGEIPPRYSTQPLLLSLPLTH